MLLVGWCAHPATGVLGRAEMRTVVTPVPAAPYGNPDLQALALQGAATEVPQASEADPEVSLWQRFVNLRDMEAREKLILLHLPYARALAAGLYKIHSYHETEFTEYVQLATLGLIECIDRFDPSHGVKFTTYAYLRIRGAVGDGLAHISERQEQLSLHQRLVAERVRAVRAAHAMDLESCDDDQLLNHMADISVSLVLSTMLADTALMQQADSALPDRSYESVALNQVMARVHASLDQLTPREQSVVRCHYLQGMTYELVSQTLGITRGRVAQLHEQALRKLRKLIAPESF